MNQKRTLTSPGKRHRRQIEDADELQTFNRKKWSANCPKLSLKDRKPTTGWALSSNKK